MFAIACSKTVVALYPQAVLPLIEKLVEGFEAVIGVPGLYAIVST